MIPDWDIAQRESLRDRVTRILEAEPDVERVELTGSLASGTADIYSDIDLIAHLKPGLVDRQFFFTLPAAMDAVGSRIIDGWGFAAMPYYVGTFSFTSLPLFWHVDVTCRAAAPEWHIDGSDLRSVTRWEQRFKMWIESNLRLARVENQGVNPAHKLDFDAYLADMKMRIAKRMDLSAVLGRPREQLANLLEMETAWHRQHGFEVDQIHEACRELHRTVFTDPQSPRRGAIPSRRSNASRRPE